MELGGIKVIFFHCRTEWEYIIAYGNGIRSQICIVAVHIIDVVFDPDPPNRSF